MGPKLGSIINKVREKGKGVVFKDHTEIQIIIMTGAIVIYGELWSICERYGYRATCLLVCLNI